MSKKKKGFFVVGSSWPIRLTKSMGGSKTKVIGDKIIAEGTVSFGRRKKNGNKLASQDEIRRSQNASNRKHKFTTVSKAFPPIRLDI